MRLLALILYGTIYLIKGFCNRFLSFFYKKLMINCGKNVRFSAITSDMIYRNISIGNDVFIGPDAKFVATKSKIYIGNKVLFGPNVTIIGGNHRIKDVGIFIFDVKEKQPDDDLDVHVEDDVWIGANVTILKGVRVGRGAVVAAGSLVLKEVPPYTVAGGVPAKVLKSRFSTNEIIAHEKKIYPLNKRYSIEQIALFKNNE